VPLALWYIGIPVPGILPPVIFAGNVADTRNIRVTYNIHTYVHVRAP
jgi:hypothetical protein